MSIFHKICYKTKEAKTSRRAIKTKEQENKP